jgi:hypothetical protein
MAMTSKSCTQLRGPGRQTGITDGLGAGVKGGLENRGLSRLTQTLPHPSPVSSGFSEPLFLNNKNGSNNDYFCCEYQMLKCIRYSSTVSDT